ncbi:MAG: hypothetical protein ND895_16465 [Pyrinomonadaceae bacterium]|nr:hypothetical protein [Pyrinomonadaceae bacterium]
MNRKQSAGAALLPIVAFVSSLGQDLLDAPIHGQQTGEREKAATEPDLRLEPIASRVAQGKLYSLAPLADGRILAFDRRDHKPVYVMTKSRPANGTYTVTFGGALVVKDGVVTGVTGGRAQSTAFIVIFDRPVLDVKWRVRLPADKTIRADGKRTLSIIDLKDGRLMLLEGNRIYQLKIRLAPEGEYRLPGIGSLSVSKGALGPVRNGDPDYDYPEDFAP